MLQDASKEIANDFSIAFKKIQVHGATKQAYETFLSSGFSFGVKIIQYGKKCFNF